MTAVSQNEQPLLVQAFDYSKVQEYYKIIPRFFGTTERLVKASVVEKELQLYIHGEKLPEVVIFNNERYTLLKDL